MRTRPLRALALVAATTAIVLGVPAPAHADLAHDPVTNCQPPVDASPLVTVFAGEAHAPVGHAASVVSLTVRCTYFDDDGSPAHWATATANGPVVTFVDYGGVYGDEFETMCQSAEVVYADGHRASRMPICTSVAYSANIGPPPGGGPTLRCDHARGPSVTHTWVIEATAVAGVRGDVPLSTDVSCTLRDTAGGEVTASASSIGGVAVTSRAELANVASLVSKCYETTVLYLSAAMVSAESCEVF